MSDKEQQIEELIELNDELENYFRNTIIPQLYVDGELKLQKFTPPAMTQFSLSDNDLGKNINDIKDNIRFPSIIEDVNNVIESKEILEKEIQTTDLRWFQMNVIPYIKKKNNKTDGVIITFVEITMRIKDLKEQEKLIADYEILLDTISHDIKNPLTSLVLAVDLFKTVSSNDEKEFQTLLNVVDSALSKMNKLINELTEERKNDYGNNAEAELLNFGQVFQDVRIALSDTIKSGKASITTTINVSEVTFSRRKLRTIIYNLLNNAIKFRATDRDLKIVVTTYKEDDFVVISVKDNGIGIDQENLEKIFTKYGRIETSVEGSGIGLFLIREIVNIAGGKILVKSERGIGSEFLVYLKI